MCTCHSQVICRLHHNAQRFPRVHLTDAEFRKRILQSKAWVEHLAKPPIPPFDEPAAMAEIEQRNAIRANNHLPLLDVEQEIARLRALRVQ